MPSSTITRGIHNPYIQFLNKQTMRTPAAALTIEHALLGFVCEQPLHGYEIYRQLSASEGLWQVWRLKQSQLYALLTKLEETHYLITTLQPQAARPPRKVYALTEVGRTAFQRWLTTPVIHGRQMRIEFLAKLYCAHRQNPALVRQLLEQQTGACQQWREELQGQSAVEPEADLFVYVVQQFRLNQVESYLAWLATCRQALLAPAEHT
jgi:DNA-binding PadR family transcriptional regulator